MICPGIGISADALFEKTARLPRVDIRKPARVIGSTTVGSLQSGLYYGYLGLVDGILERLLEEMGKEATVVATGGLAALIGKGSKYIKHVDDLLTLDGLRLIWERNTRRSPAVKPHPSNAASPRPRGACPAASRGPAERSVENYFNYFTEIEEQFQRRRGGILLLSTLDWALIETWKDAGIPLEAVLRGIDGAFERYEKRPSKRKVNSLAYCAQEVLAAAEEMKEAAVGVSSSEKPERNRQDFRPAEIVAFLRRNADQLLTAKLPERPGHFRAGVGAGDGCARCVNWLRRWKSESRRGWKTWNGG